MTSQMLLVHHNISRLTWICSCCWICSSDIALEGLQTSQDSALSPTENILQDQKCYYSSVTW